MKIELKEFCRGDEYDISRLIKTVYDEFVAPDYSDHGNAFFYAWIKPTDILKRQKARNTWLAYCDDKIVGVIEIRDDHHISLLFVDKEYHRQGIARSLFYKALKECKERDPELKEFSVNASPFSIPIYEKLGFERTKSEIQEQNGLKFLPMIMKL
ncbi:GNAT family N-acetyltransferase [Aduncisulcus paluster]|uniref:GNAT family N-acetyltransferase n=1 Tax=Aduncisulcus paluster TaxID=2918883 RepID=A0ABQ5JUN2_9EUKA|nr:GNAT family N-acetyltransferase [Aduncisulcus paluster]